MNNTEVIYWLEQIKLKLYKNRPCTRLCEDGFFVMLSAEKEAIF